MQLKNINVTGNVQGSAPPAYLVTVSPAINGQTLYDLATETITATVAGTYTITPSGTFRLRTKMWGGGGETQSGSGGAGGFAGGDIPLASGQSYILSLPASGGAAGTVNGNPGIGTRGGAYVGLFTSSVSLANALIVAGAGGGGVSGDGPAPGGGGGGTTGQSGNVSAGGCGLPLAGGGTQVAGGVASGGGDSNSPAPVAGSALAGGASGRANNAGWGPGGGGGSGYYGGGGGNGGGSCRKSGGGGSSYIIGTATNTSNLSASGATPGNSGDGARGTGGNPGTLVGKAVLSLAP